MKREYSCEIVHASTKKSKSKYKGGFKNGKNTSEYNHDYYMKNKDKWKKDKKVTGSSDNKSILSGLTWVKRTAAKLAVKLVSSLMPKKEKKQLFKANKEDLNSAENGRKWANNFMKHNKKAHEMLENYETNKEFGAEDGPASSLKPKRNDGTKYKYKYRITLPNGKYRYFYSDVEYIEFLSNVSTHEADTIENDALAVNPKYDPNDNDYGYEYNCGYCSTAYELRRRGYDVEAISDIDGELPDDLSKFFVPNAENDAKYKNYEISKKAMDRGYITPKEEAQNFCDKLKENGEGSRGMIAVYWDPKYGGGGHSMAWEVENGKVKIVDSQSGTVISEEQFTSNMSQFIIWNYYQYPGGGPIYMRTDNLDINPAILNPHKAGLSTDSDKAFIDKKSNSPTDEDMNFTDLKNYEWTIERNDK